MKLMSFHVGAFSGMSRGGPYDGHVACLRENQPEVCPGGMSFFAGGFGAYPNRWRSADGVWREVPGRGHELNAAAVRLHCTRLMNHLHQILLGFPVATTDNKPFDLWCVDYEGGESDELPSLGARLKGPRGSEWRRFLRLTADLCESQLPGRTGFYDLRAISGDESWALPTVVEEGRNFVCCYPFIASQDVLHVLDQHWKEAA